MGQGHNWFSLVAVGKVATDSAKMNRYRPMKRNTSITMNEIKRTSGIDLRFSLIYDLLDKVFLHVPNSYTYLRALTLKFPRCVAQASCSLQRSIDGFGQIR